MLRKMRNFRITLTTLRSLVAFAITPCDNSRCASRVFSKMSFDVTGSALNRTGINKDFISYLYLNFECIKQREIPRSAASESPRPTMSCE